MVLQLELCSGVVTVQSSFLQIYILHSLGFGSVSSLSLADYFAWDSNIPITYVFVSSIST